MDIRLGFTRSFITPSKKLKSIKKNEKQKILRTLMPRINDLIFMEINTMSFV